MIVIDTETTGLEPAIHALISVGAIDFENPDNQFYEECGAWKGAHIDKKALEINGFLEKDIVGEGKQPIESLVLKFSAWASGIKEQTFAGENPSMDRDFMRASFQRAGANWFFAYRTFDLHSICYAHMIRAGLVPPTERNHTGLNLDAILEYVGLPKRAGVHNAMEDAKLEAEAFSRLLYGKNLLAEYGENPMPDKIKN